MSASPVLNAVSIIKMLTEAVLIILSMISIKRTKKVSEVFFMLGVACILVAELYWFTVYNLSLTLKLTFLSAQDIGIWGALLLLTSCLRAAVPQKKKMKPVYIVGAMLLSGTNAAIYIYYENGIFQSIVYGVVLWYFTAVILQTLDDTGVFAKKKHEYAMAGSYMLIMVVEIVMILSQGTVRTVLDYLCEAMWFTVLSVLTVAVVRRIRSQSESAVPFAMLLGLTCILTMYLSFNPFYSIADVLLAVSMVFMFTAVNRGANRS